MIMLKTLGKQDQFSILDNTLPTINILIKFVRVLYSMKWLGLYYIVLLILFIIIIASNYDVTASYGSSLDFELKFINENSDDIMDFQTLAIKTDGSSIIYINSSNYKTNNVFLDMFAFYNSLENLESIPKIKPPHDVTVYGNLESIPKIKPPHDVTVYGILSDPYFNGLTEIQGREDQHKIILQKKTEKLNSQVCSLGGDMKENCFEGIENPFFYDKNHGVVNTGLDLEKLKIQTFRGIPYIYAFKNDALKNIIFLDKGSYFYIPEPKINLIIEAKPVNNSFGKNQLSELKGMMKDNDLDPSFKHLILPKPDGIETKFRNEVMKIDPISESRLSLLYNSEDPSSTPMGDGAMFLKGDVGYPTEKFTNSLNSSTNKDNTVKSFTNELNTSSDKSSKTLQLNSWYEDITMIWENLASMIDLGSMIQFVYVPIVRAITWFIKKYDSFKKKNIQIHKDQ